MSTAATACDDRDACTTDSCSLAGACSHLAVTCDDGAFCNGAETCDASLGCQAGPPLVVDDGNDCTVDSCDELNDEVVHRGACWEICNNGIDDNGDGFADCADWSCSGESACLEATCASSANRITDSSVVGGDIGDAWDHNVTASCTGSEAAEEFVYQLTPRWSGLLRLSLDISGESLAPDLSLSVRTACADASSELGCSNRGGEATDESLVVEVVEGQILYVVVERFNTWHAPGYPWFDFNPDFTLRIDYQEYCDNFLDDNRDGMVDCADPTCLLNAGCACAAAHAIDVPADISGRTTADLLLGDPSCAGGTSGGTVSVLVASRSGRLHFGLRSSSHVFASLRTACNDPSSELGCFGVGPFDREASLEIDVVEDEVLHVVVESFYGSAPFELRVMYAESCGDGVDDNGNGLVDCEDPYCSLGEHCLAAACEAAAVPATAPVNFEASILEGVFSAESDSACSDPGYGSPSGSRRPKIIYELIASRTAPLRVALESSERLVFSARTSCNDPSSEVACTSASAPTNWVDLNLSEGDTLYIVVEAEDGFVPVTGQFSLAINYAELCTNSADDDGDGWTDCNDPECAEECLAAACEASAIAVADNVSITGDTSVGADRSDGTCTYYGGRELVYAVTPSRTGSLRLILRGASIALSARRGCNDVDSELGCSHSYASTEMHVDVTEGEVVYVVVESFSLAYDQSYTLLIGDGENCGNLADDNSDGLVDCADPFCLTDAGCVAAACEADAIVASESATVEGDTREGADRSDSTCERGEEIVYKVTPTRSGRLHLYLDSSEADLGMSVRTACNDPATELGCVDRYGSGVTEELVVAVMAGVTVYVVVEHWAWGGRFTLRMALE